MVLVFTGLEVLWLLVGVWFVRFYGKEFAYCGVLRLGRRDLSLFVV